MPEHLRVELESSLGVSLAHVRIHADDAAAQAARALLARAFTHGQDLYFARAAYAPHSLEGRRLIAHEIAHTVQRPGPYRAAFSIPGEPHERAADTFADAFASRGVGARISARDLGTAPATIHRYEDRELAEAAQWRQTLLNEIGVGPDRARAILGVLLRARRRGRPDHIVGFTLDGLPYRLRFEDLDFLIARARYATARHRTPRPQSAPARQAAPPQAASATAALPPPPRITSTQLMTPQEVEDALIGTEAFGDAMQHAIQQRLRHQGIRDVSEHIHFLSPGEFFARCRADNAELWSHAPSGQVNAAIQQVCGGFVGYYSPHTRQANLNRAVIGTTAPLHEAVHMLEHPRFITATSDPTFGDPPEHRTPFHEAVTQYFTTLIADEIGVPVFPEYAPDAVPAVQLVADVVGNERLLRAYMTGDVRPILARLPMFDEFLIAWYRGDGRRARAALAVTNHP